MSMSISRYLSLIFSIIVFTSLNTFGQFFSGEIIDLDISSDNRGDLILIDVDLDGDWDIINRTSVLELYVNNGNFDKQDNLLDFNLMVDYN